MVGAVKLSNILFTPTDHFVLFHLFHHGFLSKTHLETASLCAEKQNAETLELTAIMIVT
jgi:hypothetical protein